MDWSEILVSSGITVAINGVLIFWLKERLKQSIKHVYDKELEHLKKDFELEIDRKKKLYDGKLAQYKNYYALLDGYSSNSRRQLFDKFQTSLVDLLRNPTQEATINYVKNSLSLQGDISEIFITFKNEINGLRLEAGDDLLALLDLYVTNLEVAQDKTVQFMTWMNTNYMLFVTEPEAAQLKVNEFMNDEFSGEGEALADLQSRIFLEMRKELGIV
ncbi:hypothetical protein [Aliivibrio finisterrensis]|uniref:hypothetical protein n=1 Tax=Aliivibrio finisterrensis TaxID=511998 RepID=UPI001AD624A1|nr:hypothetical protein [Aliivibrio finisterrensis]